MAHVIKVLNLLDGRASTPRTIKYSKGDIYNVSGRFSGLLVWYGIHLSIICLTFSSILRNHIFLNILLVSLVLVDLHELVRWLFDVEMFGSTIQFPQRIIFELLFTVYSSLVLLKSCSLTNWLLQVDIQLVFCSWVLNG